MLRSARLIEHQLNNISNLIKQKPTVSIKSIDINVKQGDIMTGWEIIAGLPLETQKDVIKVQQWFRFNLGAQYGGFYRWNGDAWEVVE